LGQKLDRRNVAVRGKLKRRSVTGIGFLQKTMQYLSPI
jgi:hypothetical protein